ncbi:MAG: RNA polymerase sigma factor [Desulfobacterales bacterium]|nr:RNA polymerase sigma factor [Desulfobacterales bacterium]
MAGSETAFAQLVDLFHGDIFRMIYSRIRSHMDTEDLTQDVFVLAYKNILKLKDISRFKSWLFSIAMNKVRDFYRKKRIQTLFGTSAEYQEAPLSEEKPYEDPSILDDLMREEFWKRIKILLDKLSRREQEVFLLRFTDQLSIKEISQVLKKNESTVKTHLYRAINKFKKESELLQLLREETL